MRPFNGVGFKQHPRGPRIGYWNWDLPGLATAVHVDGTINDPATIDRGSQAIERAVKKVPGVTSALAERLEGGRYPDIVVDRAA